MVKNNSSLCFDEPLKVAYSCFFTEVLHRKCYMLLFGKKGRLAHY